MSPVTRSKRNHPAKDERIEPPRKRSKPIAKGSSKDDSTDSSNADKHELPRRRNVRGRRGSLQELPNMPLDIIDEVRFHIFHESTKQTSSIHAGFISHAPRGLAKPCQNQQALSQPPHESGVCTLLEGRPPKRAGFA